MECKDLCLQMLVEHFIGLLSLGANFRACIILRAQNVTFYLVTVTLLIAAKQFPSRTPASNLIQTPCLYYDSVRCFWSLTSPKALLILHIT